MHKRGHTPVIPEKKELVFNINVSDRIGKIVGMHVLKDLFPIRRGQCWLKMIEKAKFEFRYL